MLHAVAVELHRFIQRAVDAYHAYDVQDEVFAAHVFGEFPLEHEFDGGWHLEPALARHHACRHIGGAHACRKGAKRSVCAGVAVGADYKVARAHKPLLGQQRVFNAHSAHVEKVFQVLFACKLAAQLALLRALYIFVGGKVIHDEGNLLPVGNRLCARLFKFFNGYGACNIVGEHHIELCVYELAGLYFFKSRMRRKDFLRHCHRHSFISLKVLGAAGNARRCRIL